MSNVKNNPSENVIQRTSMTQNVGDNQPEGDDCDVNAVFRPKSQQEGCFSNKISFCNTKILVV